MALIQVSVRKWGLWSLDNVNKQIDDCFRSYKVSIAAKITLASWMINWPNMNSTSHPNYNFTVKSTPFYPANLVSNEIWDTWIKSRGEKPAIGQLLWGSLPRLTNDRNTKREKMTSVCFGLLWSEKCKQNHARFWTELGHKLITEKCKPFRDRKVWNEILNNGSTQHIKTLFIEGFSLVACNRCYTALCQFCNWIRA